jgi:Septum formation initiator
VTSAPTPKKLRRTSPTIRRRALPSLPSLLPASPSIPLFTRSITLLLVLVSLALTLTYPVRRYADQLGRINDLKYQISQDDEIIRKYQTQIALYKNTTFITEEARKNLRYTLPNEHLVVVIGDMHTTPSATPSTHTNQSIPPGPAPATNAGDQALNSPALNALNPSITSTNPFADVTTPTPTPSP